jgi:hypothetical protein
VRAAESAEVGRAELLIGEQQIMLIEVKWNITKQKGIVNCI